MRPIDFSIWLKVICCRPMVNNAWRFARYIELFGVELELFIVDDYIGCAESILFEASRSLIVMLLFSLKKLLFSRCSIIVSFFWQLGCQDPTRSTWKVVYRSVSGNTFKEVFVYFVTYDFGQFIHSLHHFLLSDRALVWNQCETQLVNSGNKKEVSKIILSRFLSLNPNYCALSLCHGYLP